MKKNIQCCGSLSGKLVLGVSLALVATGSAGASGRVSASPHADVVTSVTQQKTIKGTVVDASGEVIIGANVVVKGTANGTITDIDGNFTLEVPANCTLQVSYIGYDTQEVKVTGATQHLSIKMKEDTETLEEVVVVGYGVQKKVNLTGAVASVDFEEQAKSRPITSVSQALAGVSPGLQAMQSSGEPGSDGAALRIRGTGTLNEAAPLVIIDGMEGTLDALNPQDIENISVLKDAASCAIYGVRGANGVILVTTKQGEKDKIRINYSGRVSFTHPSKLIDMVSDYPTYMELMNESYTNIGQSARFSPDNINMWREKMADPNGMTNGVPNYVAYPSTDWAEELFSNGLVHDHNLSVNGGSDKIRFMMSAGYMDNQGLVANTGLKRYSVRANIEANPFKWLTVGTRTYASQQDKEAGNFSDANNFLRQTTPGIYPEWGEGNNRFGYPECSDESPTANSPLSKLYNKDGFKRTSRFNTTLYSKIKLIKGLSWDFNFNYDRYFYEQRVWDKAVGQTRFSTGDVYSADLNNLNSNFETQSSYKYTLENLLNYATTINEVHDLSALLGYQEVYYDYYKVTASKKGMVSDEFNQFDNVLNMNSIGGTESDWASRSVFGRVNYAYNSRYLVEANFRYDGSSRFHKDNRWGFFPSFSGAWRISEEAFMENTRTWLDNLKVRLSWGKLGNSELKDSDGNYNYYPYVATYSTTNYIFGNALANGLSATKLANPLLEWESTTSMNIGIDATFLNGRLNFTADFYNKTTDGILYQPNLLPSIGDKTKPYENTAEVNNKGIEFSLGWQDNIGGFHYSISGNFAYNHNEVTKYRGTLQQGWTVDENGNKVYKTNIGDVSTGSEKRIIEGHQINEFYLKNIYSGDGSYYNADGSVNINGGPKDGMIRTEQDAKWVKDMMAAGYTFKPGNSFDQSHIYYGDYIYADSNGDGEYGGNNDETFQGISGTPKYNFGLQLAASYKGFDLSMNWAGAAGFKIYWGPSAGLNSTSTNLGVEIPQDVADDHYFYDPANPNDARTNLNATFPRLTYQDGNVQNYASSTQWLFNGNYLKLKNITFGYTFPKNWLSKAYIESLRLYVSAENMLNFNSFRGQDPETGATGYAPNKSFAIGANITF